MGLKEYHKKRGFKKTPEPKGSIRKSKTNKTKKAKTGKERKKKRLFVIQKHVATHLHYDLRIEDQGVLKSWAVPKKPPKIKGVKRLAIMTEDHPLEYASFSGKIPEGNYGAGRVEIWDKGEAEIEEKNKKKYVVQLEGKKLKGRYCLVFFRKPNKWLFFKC